MPAAHRPRLEEQRRGPGDEASVIHRDGAAALGPAALGRVAHREPVGHRPRGQRGQEGAAATTTGRRPRGAGRAAGPAATTSPRRSRRTRTSAPGDVVRAWAGVTPAAPVVSGRSPRGPGRRPCSTRRGASGSGGARRRCRRSRPAGQAPRRPSGAGARAAAPMRLRVVVGGDPEHRGSGAALDAGAARSPSTSWVIISGPGRAVVRTSGTPADIASCRTSGYPSPRDARTATPRAPTRRRGRRSIRRVDAVLEPELAHLCGEVVGAGPVAPDRSVQPGSCSWMRQKASTTCSNCFLGASPATAVTTSSGRAGALLRVRGERVGDDLQLGGGAAEASPAATSTRSATRRRVAAGRTAAAHRGSLTRLEEARCSWSHQRDVSRRELGDHREQLRCGGDEDVGLDRAERARRVASVRAL